MDFITLIKGRPGDEERLLALYRACAKRGMETGSSHWNEYYPDGEIAAQDILDGAVYLALSGDTLAGAVSILKTDDVEQMGLPFRYHNAFVLARLCAAPELQGRNVGSRILDLAHARAKGLGYEACHLLCAESSPVANALYQSRGYLEIARVHEYGHDFIAYEKRL